MNAPPADLEATALRLSLAGHCGSGSAAVNKRGGGGGACAPCDLHRTGPPFAPSRVPWQAASRKLPSMPGAPSGPRPWRCAAEMSGDGLGRCRTGPARAGGDPGQRKPPSWAAVGVASRWRGPHPEPDSAPCGLLGGSWRRTARRFAGRPVALHRRRAALCQAMTRDEAVRLHKYKWFASFCFLASEDRSSPNFSL